MFKSLVYKQVIVQNVICLSESGLDLHQGTSAGFGVVSRNILKIHIKICSFSCNVDVRGSKQLGGGQYTAGPESQ